MTAVGDPHQSIYGWRGASAGGLERFPDRFPRDGRRACGAGPGPLPVDVVAQRPRDPRRRQPRRRAAACRRRASGVPGDRPGRVPRLEAAPRAGAGTVLATYPATVEEEAAAIARFVGATRWRSGGGPGAGRRCAGRPRPSCAASGRSSTRSRSRCAPPACRSRWSGSVVCCTRPRSSTSCRSCGPRTTRRAVTRSCGCSPVPRVRLGIADLHALAQWAGELAGSHARRRARGRPVPAAAAVAAALDDDATVVVEGDVVDERSIVDALDDLPPRGWRSGTGRYADRRRTVSGCGDLARLLRTLRSHTYLSLPELVGEAERLLGLDIEVAAASRAEPGPGAGPPGRLPGRRRPVQRRRRRPHARRLPRLARRRGPGGARARAAGHRAGPGRRAAHHRARREGSGVGRRRGRRADGRRPAGDRDERAGRTRRERLADRPGRAAVPAARRRRRAAGAGRGAAPSTRRRWTSLRKEFRRHVGAHEVAEERRLAYVALTRARSALLAQRLVVARPQGAATAVPVPRGAGAGRAGDPGRLDRRSRTPARRTRGPRSRSPRTWPIDPFGAGPRRAHVPGARGGTRSATGASRGRRSARRQRQPRRGPRTADASTWRRSSTRVLDLLLAERDRVTRAVRPTSPCPPHLSASAVVRLAADRGRVRRGAAPTGAARAVGAGAPGDGVPRLGRAVLRRRVARRRRGPARRGRRLGRRRRRPGRAARRVPGHAVGGTAARVRSRSTSRPRSPGYVLRCRVDAVFDEPDGRVTVVDWKTGRPPADEAAARAREVQLAVYRLAWSRWSGTPLERVGAAFCYVGAGLDRRPRSDCSTRPRSRTCWPTRRRPDHPGERAGAAQRLLGPAAARAGLLPGGSAAAGRRPAGRSGDRGASARARACGRRAPRASARRRRRRRRCRTARRRAATGPARARRRASRGRAGAGR